MDALIDFINTPTADTLAFLGIAIAYGATGCFSNASGWRQKVARIAFYIAGIVFLALAFFCQIKGTAKGINAGEVLAYLGIGAGLVCTAWTSPSHGKLAWSVLIIGVLFELIGLILIKPAGLI